jgi:prevent-host-death family protein
VSLRRLDCGALIEAAQITPQVITKHNTPVAVLVSPEYFSRGEVAAKAVHESFYSQLLQLREDYPQDSKGLAVAKSTREKFWSCMASECKQARSV